MLSVHSSESRGTALRYVAGLAAAALLVMAWRAIPSSLRDLMIPPGAPRGLSFEVILGYTRGLVPLTAALMLFWYALAANRAVERRRIKLAVLVSLATLAVASGAAFVIFTAWAFVSGSILGPVAGMLMAFVTAPSALFLGALIGFVGSRFTQREMEDA